MKISKLALTIVLLQRLLCGCQGGPELMPSRLGCPPSDELVDSGHARLTEDLDGDGRKDYEFPNHSVTKFGCRLVCVSNNGTHVLYVICSLNYVGRCPYNDGENRWSWVDGKFRGKSVDGGFDDDSDGKLDSIEYEYDPGNGKVRIIVREDGINVTKGGEYVIDAPSNPAGLPTPDQVPQVD